VVGNGSLNSSILYKIYFLTWGSLCLYVVSHGGSMSGSIILLTWTVEIKKKNGIFTLRSIAKVMDHFISEEFVKKKSEVLSITRLSIF